MTSIALPSNLKSIGVAAFAECDNLKLIINPSNLRIVAGSSEYGGIGWNAKLVITASADQLGRDGDFLYYSDDTTKNLYSYIGTNKNVVIPNGMTSIVDYAFYNRNDITSVFIPNSVTTIRGYAFYGCSNLASAQISNCLTGIWEYAFYGCNNLAAINLPNSVANIGDYAFAYCSSLSSMTVPSNVSIVGKYSFSHCSSLDSVNLPNNMTIVGSYAFWDCGNLSSVTIPNTVINIEDGAFYYCTSLKNVQIQGTTPCEIGSRAFTDGSSSLILYVPCGTADAYKSAKGWSAYADKIVELSQEGGDEDGEQGDDDDDVVEPTDLTGLDYVLYFPSTEVNTGTTSTLSLNLKNAAEDITAFQCDIYLPEGVEWASTIDKRGNKVLTQPTFNDR